MDASRGLPPHGGNVRPRTTPRDHHEEPDGRTRSLRATEGKEREEDHRPRRSCDLRSQFRRIRGACRNRHPSDADRRASGGSVFGLRVSDRAVVATAANNTNTTSPTRRRFTDTRDTPQFLASCYFANPSQAVDDMTRGRAATAPTSERGRGWATVLTRGLSARSRKSVSSA